MNDALLLPASIGVLLSAIRSDLVRWERCWCIPAEESIDPFWKSSNNIFSGYFNEKRWFPSSRRARQFVKGQLYWRRRKSADLISLDANALENRRGLSFFKTFLRRGKLSREQIYWINHRHSIESNGMKEFNWHSGCGPCRNFQKKIQFNQKAFVLTLS